MKGATYRPEKGKWMAQIRLNGKNRFLGYFDSEAEAVAAHLAARGRCPQSQAGRVRANRNRYEAAEARQMERCDRMLAEEEELKRPERMRCPCGGLIIKGHVQEHHCKYLHRQDWRSVA